MAKLNNRFLTRRFKFTIRQVLLPTCCLLAFLGLVIYGPPQKPEKSETSDSGSILSEENPEEERDKSKNIRKLLLNFGINETLDKSGNILLSDVPNVDTFTVSDPSRNNFSPIKNNEVPKLQEVINVPIAKKEDSVKSDSNTKTSLSISRNLTWERRLPQALIIGVKKGGTRALLEFLRLHPDVRAPGPEVHFFDRFYDKGIDWYRNQMPASLAEQLTIEKTPSYFIVPDVPAKVRLMSPSIKLIVVVRDPVTRAISDYTQAASKHPEVRSFEENAFLNASTGLVDTSWSAIKIGVYAKHLERWRRQFPASQMHFVSGEGLIADPVRELTRVERFLGLETVITDKHFYFNETKGFPCLKKSEGNARPHCLGATKGRIHAKIEDETIQRLKEFFSPFNLKLYQMVGQDFGWP